MRPATNAIAMTGSSLNTRNATIRAVARFLGAMISAMIHQAAGGCRSANTFGSVITH